MNLIKKFSSKAKRTSAMVLSAMIAASTGIGMAMPLTVNAAEILSNEQRGVIFADSRTDFRDESIYFLITTRFYDGDSSNNARTSEDKKAQNPENDPSWRGDFKGLIDKLDYIKALGFTAIWITPVVENDSGYDYHGYHAYDFSAVDTRYESNGVTYQTLIDAVHAKGMKIIQDVVVNHTCNWGEKNLLKLESDVFTERNSVVMAGGKYGPGGQYTDTENIYHHNGYCGGGDWDNQEAQKKTIADDCLDLNTENPKVYNYLVNCYTNYINMGVDGFRVDTVKHVSRLTFNSVFVPAFKQAGGDKFYMFGEVCTKGHDVWYRDNPPISTSFYTWADDSSWTSRWSNDTAANTALLDEHYAAHMNMNNQPTSTNAFLNGNDYHAPDNSIRSGMDSIDFQMHWSFNNANEAFNTALGEDRYFSDATWNVVYVDSHDYGPDNCQTLRYNFGTDAWAENLSLMFTFRGIPCIYYGSEIEFQAGKPIDVGPNSPLSQTGRAYYGDHIEGNVDTSDFTVFGNLSGEVQNTLNSTLSQHIMRLNRIRQAVPALRKGQYSTEGCSGNMAFKRRYTDSNTDSFACVAISGDATFSGIPNGTYVDAVTGDVKNVTGGSMSVSCSGKGNLRVYVLNTSKTPAPGRVIPNGDYLTDGGAAEKIGPVDIVVHKIDPTGISLSKTSTTITEGSSEKVTATITPSDATNQTVTWTSSDNSVATVSGGTINAISAGTATITAKTYNGLSATIKVTVKADPNVIKPTGITLSSTSLELEAGSTGSLTATVKPTNATNQTVTWTSGDNSVATVSNGTVTAVKAGTAVITAATVNGYEATCTVTVTGKAVTYIDHGVYFEKPSGWSSVNVYFFDNNQTVGTAWPGTAMKDMGNGVYSYEYTTTSSTLKLIFNNGGSGSGNQTADLDYKDCGYYTINGFQNILTKPVEVLPTSVSLNKTSATISVGNTVSLSATVSPSDATNKTVTWSSSDTSVATVSGGTVTGKSAGTATITVKTSNGKTATCTVTVSSVAGGALTNKATISTTSVPKDTSVTVKGSATGGNGTYKYAFYYKKSTSAAWATIGELYGNTTEVSFVPAAIAKYYVKVNVKDGTGKIVTKQFTLNSVKPTSSDLQNTSTHNSSGIVKGTAIKITGKATGGSGSYKYGFYYKKTTSKAFTTIGTEYGSATTATFTPGSNADYNIRINVKDSNGTIVTKQYKVLAAGSSALTNNSTISSTSPTVGDTVTITGSASGGTSPYKYAFYYKKSTSSNYTTIGTAYSSSTTANFKPGSAATYNVKVSVKDNAGNVVDKTFNVTAKSSGGTSTSSALTNNSTISATSVSKGTEVKVTAKAAGGTSPYYYAVYYKKSSSTSWTAIGTEYGTGTSFTFTPATAATYNVMVKVMDNTGETISKEFTVKAS